MGRVIALDVGTKTIGVAISDPLCMFAQPVCTLCRRGVRRDAAALVALCAKWEPERVIVGLPLELDGSEQRPVRLARQIGEAVHEATGLPVDYVDERYTSVESERELIAMDMSRARRKQVIDQVAAMKILERWLAERQ